MPTTQDSSVCLKKLIFFPRVPFICASPFDNLISLSYLFDIRNLFEFRDKFFQIRLLFTAVLR